MAKLFHQTLFNQKLVAKHQATTPTPPAHKALLHDWASTIANQSITKQKEQAIRSSFIQTFFIQILGYTPFGAGNAQTIQEEQNAGAGSADAALGFFSHDAKKIISVVELKGADTRDLDAIMPGRHKSPVTQAWEYAMDTSGCQFVLVSNMVEIRLYAVGHTRLLFESFDIRAIADSDAEYQRFMLLLAAPNLLQGQTANLLKGSAAADKAITQQLYQDYRQWRLQLIIALAQHNAHIGMVEVIEYAQTILDRIIFIAFAEDRELLPAHTLKNAFEHRDPYNPLPIWHNFKGLFLAIDKGNATLNIPAYNGGLFRADPIIDALIVPDETCRFFKKLGEYDFASEVSVSVLGHIFEQSISDLESLTELVGQDNFQLESLKQQTQQSSTSVTGKRKQEGVIYTPDEITAFIVEHTLGAYIEKNRAKIQQAYLADTSTADNIIYRKPTAPEKKTSSAKDTNRITELLFYNAWRDALSAIKVLDPACGSGAFLVAAYDLLNLEYRQINEQIQAITGSFGLFDINHEILNSNLFGVDLNPESIEISKLSLWLKTAQRGKPLQSLETNLRVGNSLINEAGAEFSPRAFDWQGAFPQVFGAGGFDVVLGNPPYVRQERFSSTKPYLQTHYQVYHGVADLYSYFYELGVRLLKPSGMLGYISSSTFFKTGSGAPLRQFLAQQTALNVLVDFGDIQVFEGVTTYPAIVILSKTVPTENHQIQTLNLKTMPEQGVSAAFEQQAVLMPQTQLGGNIAAATIEGQSDVGAVFDREKIAALANIAFAAERRSYPQASWQLESGAQAALRHKLTHGYATLKQVYGSPYRGVLTGLNEAFVIDGATKQRLMAQDAKSADLLKPFLEGKDLKKWRVEPRDLWLILCAKGWTRARSGFADEPQAWAWLQSHYPAIAAYLAPFAEAAKKRTDKGEFWWELRSCAYLEAFEKAKIVWADIASENKFIFTNNNYYLANTAYMLPSSDWFLLGWLNSKACQLVFTSLSPMIRGGFFRYIRQYIDEIPIPNANHEQRAHIAQLAETCQTAAEARRNAELAFTRRIPDLAGTSQVKLSTKLQQWWLLDFAGFRAEILKNFKAEIPLKDRNDWQDLFTQQQSLIRELSQQIQLAEQQLNRAVYTLFGLDEAEIALIEM
ncbi:MAG: TaqI-like C-terminal specificity domain-containing protein [Methylotenera sp.]|uniref:Eco57I restriction-modification methylase domain-containing protein n=1 Tax=Methylotenera sp. TaxID=2051956 RepID=UPI0027276CA8|nr:DNA methyltransferase [Methylotenera sp.]MDO9394815.1 TaqI-like C-terminal specificity domain-containing protein [Methylotenera sp.]